MDQAMLVQERERAVQTQKRNNVHEKREESLGRKGRTMHSHAQHVSNETLFSRSSSGGTVRS